MMIMPHNDLLKKVDKINKTFEKEKVPSQKYWVGGTYKVEGNNKTYREYLVSKEGCEFLAHKSTGEKGILFTHRYMERFKEMEQIIEQGPQQVISIEMMSQLMTTAVEKAVEKAVEVVMDKIEKRLSTNEPPKSEQISFNNTTLYTPYNVTKIASMLHRNKNTINPVLARKGIITKTNNGWVLNKKYEEAGYGKTFEGGQFGGTYVKYSEKGMKEIVKIFK